MCAGRAATGVATCDRDTPPQVWPHLPSTSRRGALSPPPFALSVGMPEVEDDASVQAPAPEPQPAVIVVDANEPLDMLDLLRERGAAVERRRLAPADYVVGPVGVERKSVGDYHSSMID